MSGCPFKSLFVNQQETSKSNSTTESNSKLTSVKNVFVEYALTKCPFLHNVELKQGYERACQLFSSPWKPKNSEQNSFLTAFQAFHGASGVVPLDASKISGPTEVAAVIMDKKGGSEAAPLSLIPTPISQDGGSGLQSISVVQPSLTVSVRLRRKNLVRTAQKSSLNGIYYGSNFASLSLSGGWGFFKLGQVKKLRKRIKSKGKGGKSGKSNQNNISKGGKSQSISHHSKNPGACPMRAVLGPLAGVVFNEAGKLACPAPIVAMRATLAKTTFIKQLRPKSLPTKLATIGGIGVLANIPCGMIREHYKKFSTGWFVAVHATIPFVAMLRKAAILPKYALGVTIIAAIVGQTIGAKIEKQRILEGNSLVRMDSGDVGQQIDLGGYNSKEIKVMA